MVLELIRRFFPCARPMFTTWSDVEGGEGYYAFDTCYTHRPVELLLGLCPSFEPPAEIAEALSCWTLVHDGTVAVWTSSADRTTVYYDFLSGYMELTYHPTVKSFEWMVAYINYYAWNREIPERDAPFIVIP